MIVLGLGTSCDETAAAVTDDDVRALSDVVSTQVDIHRRWGGVVPELASRNHVVQVLPVVHEALSRAGAVIAASAGISTSWSALSPSSGRQSISAARIASQTCRSAAASSGTCWSIRRAASSRLAMRGRP